jgi:hypothetical protein
MPASPPDAFDPYHKWLGIPRGKRPVTHYQLLGISPTETDAEVIEDAAIRQSTHVRTYQLGQHAEVCQRILNEIAQARRVLLDPEKRNEYDSKLPTSIKFSPEEIPPEPPNRSTTKKTKKQRQSSGRGMIVGMSAAGVALLATAVGAMFWFSRPDVSVKKSPASTGAVVASAEKKPPLVIREFKKAPEKAPDRPPNMVADRIVEKPPVTKKSDPDRMSPTKSFADSLIVHEFVWGNGMAGFNTLAHGRECIAVFAGGTGGFAGWTEHAAVGIDRDGDWVLDVRASHDLSCYAFSVTGLPTGFFDFDKTTTVSWSVLGNNPRQPPQELCLESEGICWIGGIGAYVQGKGLRVYVENGKWHFGGVAGFGEIEGEAIVCRFGKGVDRKKLRLSEVEWHPADGPVKLLDLKDGFCALTEISGDLSSVAQQVKLTVKDGSWWLEGKDQRGNLTVRALRVSLSGALPALPADKERMVAKSDMSVPTEIEPKIDISKPGRGLFVEDREWHNGMPRCRTLMHGNDGIAIFGGAAGNIWTSEKLSVGINKTGDWIFEGRGINDCHAYACCLTGLPAGFFVSGKMRTVAFSRNSDNLNPPPQDLCSANEGICWISGMNGLFRSGEALRVSLEEGKWRLGGVSGGSDFGGEAVVCPFGKGVDRKKLRLSEVEWHPADGPVKLLDLKDGFCALTEVRGNFMSAQQQIKLIVKNGAWWLDGKDRRGNMNVRVLRVSLTGILPSLTNDEELTIGKSAN